jgi:hypothetical protein
LDQSNASYNGSDAMIRTVFFSWQSDRSTKEGRNLIERALGTAVSRIAKGTSVDEAARDGLEVDKDTKGVPGSPPIFSTILDKIDRAAVFVPDLTFVGTRLDGSPTSNPNVLIEYGWALKSLGYSRIISVMNETHGAPTRQSLPFDLVNFRFPITYNVPDDANDTIRHAERDHLATKFEAALKAVFESTEPRGDIQSAVAAFIKKGNDLRDDWEKNLGGVEVQSQKAGAVSVWHKTVANYLSTIPRGNIYVTRFQNRIRPSGAYPAGINISMAGHWDLLQSALTRLNEILLDPDLGKP